MRSLPTSLGIAILIVASGCNRRPVRQAEEHHAAAEAPAASPARTADDGHVRQPVVAPGEDKTAPALTAKEREIFAFYLDANLAAYEDEGGRDPRHFRKLDGSSAFRDSTLSQAQVDKEKADAQRRADEVAARKTRAAFNISAQALESLL